MRYPLCKGSGACSGSEEAGEPDGDTERAAYANNETAEVDELRQQLAAAEQRLAAMAIANACSAAPGAGAAACYECAGLHVLVAALKVRTQRLRHLTLGLLSTRRGDISIGCVCGRMRR